MEKQKRFLCPLKSNRKVNNTCGKERYKYVCDVAWSAEERTRGKVPKRRKFPKDMRLKLFRVVVSGFAYDRTEYIITNNMTHSPTYAAQNGSTIRWKTEQFRR